MDLPCEIHVEYCLSGRASGRYTKAVIQLMRDAFNEHILFIPPKSRKQSFKLTGNVEKIYNQFEETGKCSIKLKQPDVLIYIREADPAFLPTFIKAIEGVAHNADFEPESLKEQH